MNLAVNFRLILYMCGWVLLFLAAVMLSPVIISLITGDGAHMVFVRSSLIVAAAALVFILQGRNQSRDEVRARDGLATVGIAWLMIGLFGAVPYWVGGVLDTFPDGMFESFSGFSTTGASVIGDIEALPESIIFWRAFSHWLGGMGIIVLMLAVLPFLGLSGVQLFKNESTLGQSKLRPRIAQTAKSLWLIYLVLSCVLLLLLLLGGMEWFDALCHTLSAIATGGFSARNLSIGHYENAFNEVVLTVFMFIGSVNFVLYYQIVLGNWKALFKDAECRVFFLIVVGSSLMVGLSLVLGGFYQGSPSTALRHAFFQVVSVISTTGFTTTDWGTWPHFCQGMLFVLFFVGGCSGSTSGGMKCIRWVLLFKGIHRTLRQHIHPRAVISVRLGGAAVSERMMTAVWSFGAIYFIALSISTLALAAMNIDLLTAISASASAIGNVGLGLGEVGPSANFSGLPGLAKCILSLDMFLGRLEFFALMILFLPEFWRK